jgi:hypothetical protein
MQSRHYDTVVDSDVGDAMAGPCVIFGIYLTAGADAASVTINDAATAAGGGRTVVLKAIATASNSFEFPNGIRFATGLSGAETGTAPYWLITYMLE